MDQVVVQRVRPGGKVPVARSREGAGRLEAVKAVDSSAVFAEVVRKRLEGTVLRYSERMRMLKEAEKLGVGRFEANLVIASVLYREGKGQAYEMRPAGGGWKGVLLAVAAVQGLIVAGAWWVFR